MGNTAKVFLEINSGVPQGRILGPFFISYFVMLVIKQTYPSVIMTMICRNNSKGSAIAAISLCLASVSIKLGY